MDKSNHRSKTVSSLKWNLLEQVFSQAIILVLGITLMRMLQPEQFGLLGMVTVFSGFLNIFSDFGLSSSLIQKQNIDRLDKNTIFWTSNAIGLLLAAVLFFSSGYLAAFYKEPSLKILARVLSVGFIITSLSTVHSAMLRKSLSYKKLVMIGIATSIISATVALVMAYHNYGVWAIVAQQLISSTLLTFSMWVFFSFFPKMEFSFQRLKQHLKFGLPLFGSNTFLYWIGNGDNLLVGKFLGAAPLGLYSRAYTLVTLPTHRISSMVTSVMFPSFSLISHDVEKVKRIFLKISRVLASVILPMMSILVIAAKPIVLVLVGAKWLGIVPIIQVLAGVASIKALSVFNGNILVSQGRTDLDFEVNIFSGTVVLIGFFIGVQFGILQVAIAYLICVALVTIPAWYIVGNIIACSLKELAANIFPQVLLSLLLTFIGMLTLKYFFSGLPSFIQITLVVIQFVCCWILLLKIFFKKNLEELLSLLSEVRG